MASSKARQTSSGNRRRCRLPEPADSSRLSGLRKVYTLRQRRRGSKRARSIVAEAPTEDKTKGVDGSRQLQHRTHVACQPRLIVREEASQGNAIVQALWTARCSFPIASNSATRRQRASRRRRDVPPGHLSVPRSGCLQPARPGRLAPALPARPPTPRVRDCHLRPADGRAHLACSSSEHATAFVHTVVRREIVLNHAPQLL